VTAFIVLAGLLLAGALLWILPPLFSAAGRAQREHTTQSSMSLAVLREHVAELDAELAAGRIDAASHARNREELERRALEEGAAAAERAHTADVRPDRRWAFGLALTVPALAISGYLVFGTPAGLDPAIPWYQIIGNHDQTWMGSVYENTKTWSAHAGSTILNMSNSPAPSAGGVNGSGFYMGAVDGASP